VSVSVPAAPTSCWTPAFHGDDDNFYCSRECAEKAEELEPVQIEKITILAGAKT
jgi:hypothetical protein